MNTFQNNCSLSKKFYLLRWAVILLFSFVVGAGCSDGGSPPPELPADAWGYSTDPLPPGFEEISAEEFLVLEANGQIRVVTPEMLQADEDLEASIAARDQGEVEAFIAQAEEAGALTSRLKDVLLTEPELIPGEFEETGDGNYRVYLNKPAGSPQNATRILLGRKAMVRSAADAIRKFKTKENQIGVITKVYNAIPSDQAWVFEELEIPATVGELQALTPAELLEIYIKIADFHETVQATFYIPPGSPPEGYVSDCKLEPGYPAQAPKAGELIISELNASKCGPHEPNSIFANYIWPLKWYATCTRDQADRGTCTAFAVAGAVEVMAAKKYGRWVNLSEQDLYYQVKNRWWPTLYGDGAMVVDIWSKVKADNYKIPLEYYWPYNPSFNRIDNEKQQTYIDSCTSYSVSYADDYATPFTKQYCSDTSGQGRAVCAKLGPFKYCSYASPVLGGYISGYRVNKAWHVFNHVNPGATIDYAQTLLAAGYPMTLGFGVPVGFSSKTTSYGDYLYPGKFRGQVLYDPYAQVKGGHAFLLTGFITNEELAGVLPGATPGSGGGYFIAKNSWSTCWGDSGYAYIPFSFAEKFGTEITLLEEID